MSTALLIETIHVNIILILGYIFYQYTKKILTEIL